MYKKAMKLHLRFATRIGNVTTEELWSLSMKDLQETVKQTFKYKESLLGSKGELDFLETKPQDPEVEKVTLMCDIVKDVYLTRLNESKQAKESLEVSREIQELEQILADKKKASIKEMSEEELEKLIKEKRESLKS